MVKEQAITLDRVDIGHDHAADVLLDMDRPRRGQRGDGRLWEVFELKPILCFE
jgi:hypothetical protein